MTKDAFIISSYANTDEKLQVLKECINQIKKFGTDIILVSHFPLPQEIYSSAKYYVYDEDNSFIPKKYYARTTGLCTWFSVGDRIFYFYDDFHALPIVRNIKMGVSIAKVFGYEFFYYTESDNIFSEKDFSKLDSMKEKTVYSGKKMCFFKNENPSNGHSAYVTSIFAGETEYFSRKFTFPSTIEQWENTTYCNNLEVDFYRFFYENVPHDLGNINELFYTPWDYFRNSKINALIYSHFQATVLYNEKDELKPYIACNNWTTEDAYIEIFVNSNLMNTLNLKPNNYWIYEMDVSSGPAHIIIKDTKKEEILFDSIIDKTNVGKLLENGRVR